MMNSTQQNEANGGTPLAEPLGSASANVCADCEYYDFDGHDFPCSHCDLRTYDFFKPNTGA